MKGSKKEKILRVAAQHFSQKGFEGASLEEIATEVGVTKPAIYYHFRDKAALYEAVLLFRLEKLAESVKEAVAASEGAEAKLRAYIEAFGAFLQEHRCFAAILAHEFADDGKQMSDRAAKVLSESLGTVTAILNEGIEEGVFAMENPMVVQMMIVSTLIMHQTTRTIRARVARNVRGFHPVSPDPSLPDLARILANKVIKSVKKDKE
ncbi:TetR/AcrR family transcriptional regulator [Hydrogenimonas urashimensis]|uniref:TetR/AcrR family transcriptional regulator n=1 Tax=Hydrogenimonas urashimensis TaxID=2740515 RepID=UPI001914F956|nr:TetR/AcrR family transcriptional regulator [Hydrogenimonas urashimensis]